MLGKNTKWAWKSNATIAVIALALLAPLGGALSEATGAAATSNATLSAFADGSVSKTLTFGAGADAASSVTLRLPANATVADAALDAGVTANSAVSSGAVVFDIGADGTADATGSLSVLGETRVVLPSAALNAYLQGHSEGKASVDIPVRVSAAAASSWSVVLDGLTVRYATSGSTQAAPAFDGQIDAVAVASGGLNASAIDLAAHFTGGADGGLTYTAQLGGDAQAAASGVTVTMNGSKVDIRSQNANWWGEVALTFAAADARGQVAFSNDVTLHVTPGEATQPTVRTDVRAGEGAVVLIDCGAPSAAGSFKIPADAVVSEASMSVEGALGISALGTTANVLAGAEVLAGLNLSDLPSEVELNASALNARLAAGAQAWGLVDLDLGVDVCPAGAVYGVQVSNISLTYARGTANATAPTQVIAAITVDGEAAANVESDSEVRFELATNGSLPAATRVLWVVDGQIAGSGAALEGVTLSRGNHTVEARATVDGAVRVYTTTVNAAADGEAKAQIAFDGVVTSTVRAGESMIVDLRTPEPLSANASVEWYVDGKLAGRGQVLADLQLAPGTHSVEARENASGEVTAYMTQVNAAGAPPAAGLTAALLVSGALCLCALAAVAWKRRR